ncbi:unnamed protein product [Sphagnum jensenii]|uniref:DNA2/NAM7 helicase helicase domain-containing protein n=1 Tax=Sphagnum jensenii TaxID=128206 RepID=A0ABP0VFU3_9BRYO
MRTVEHLSAVSSPSKAQRQRLEAVRGGVRSDLLLLESVQVDGSVLLHTSLVQTLTACRRNPLLAAERDRVAALLKRWYVVSVLQHRPACTIFYFPPSSTQERASEAGQSSLDVAGHARWQPARAGGRCACRPATCGSPTTSVAHSGRQLQQQPTLRHQILGMVSALLHRVSPSGTSADAHLPAPRLLLCAPSNAAVDELLLRLLAGIVDAAGGRRTPRLLRMGEPLEDCPPRCARPLSGVPN